MLGLVAGGIQDVGQGCNKRGLRFCAFGFTKSMAKGLMFNSIARAAAMAAMREGITKLMANRLMFNRILGRRQWPR